MGMVKELDDRSPDIESDPEEFQSFQSYNNDETPRTPNTEHLGNFEVNPPGRNDLTPSEYDDDFENFHVEFGRGAPRDSSSPESRRITSVLEDASEVSADEEQVVDLEIGDVPEYRIANVTESVSESADREEQIFESREAQEPQELHVEDLGESTESLVADTSFRDNVEEQPEEKSDENIRDERGQDETEDLDEEGVEEPEEVEEIKEPEHVEEVEIDLQKAATVDKVATDHEVMVVSRTESSDKVSDITTDRSLSMGEGGSVSSRPNVVSRDRESGSKVIRGRSDRESDKLATVREHTREGEKRLMPTTAVTHPAKRKYLTPAAVISQYAKGNLTNSEAMDAIMKFRVNKMLPKKVDGVYLDKEEVRIPRGYSFARHKGSGSKKKRMGLTRIEREIRAYQESTQMLIPRTIFARIVREIAQGWFKGEGQIKFTVEALSALQVATEDEIIRLLEISTACSYHAKRITLRVDDMRLARFCRGRQNYEFSNIN